MRLLFMAMSSAGYGETLIGMSLARQLARAGVQSHFVIDTASEKLLRGGPLPYTVLDASMGRFARLLVDERVSEFQPDAIVLSDYFTYGGVFAKRFGLDPWFVEQYGLPIMPIDIWEWEESGFSIDVFGTKQMPVDGRIVDYGAYLRPVPVCHPLPNGNPRAYPFRLFGDDERISRRTRKHLRTTFGLEPADRMVLLAVAAWQQSTFSQEEGNRLAASVPRLLAHHLAQLPPRTKFALVGAVPPALAGLPADRTLVLPACAPSRFNALLGAVDLVVTLNLAATTLGRAVLSDTPGMVLTNRFTVTEPGQLDEVERALGGMSGAVRSWAAESLPLYPFRMWPLGFHSFLDNLVAGNPYPEAVLQAELLDEPAVVSGMTAALYDADTGDRLAAARAGYRQQLDGMPDTVEVFTEAAKSLGLVVKSRGEVRVR